MTILHRLAVLALLSCGPVWGQVIITEVSSASGSVRDSDGDYSDWIELTNIGDTPEVLARYALSDRSNDRGKWPFFDFLVLDPTYLIERSFTLDPGASLVVFCSGKDKVVPNPLGDRPEFHTNFKLDGEHGDIILLSVGRHYEPVDGAYIPPLGLDQIYGRKYKSNGKRVEILEWAYIAGATPGKANPLNQLFYSATPFGPDVFFRTPGGKVLGELEVGIHFFLATGEQLEYEIPIVLKASFNGDGHWHEVRKNSHREGVFTLSYDRASLLNGPVELSPRQHDFPNPIINRFEFPEGFDFMPLITKDGHHVKVAGFIDGVRVTPEVSQSYFFASRAHNFSLPILSLEVDENAFQNLMQNDYRERGKKFELKVHMNVIEPDGKLAFKGQAGLRMHGNVARGGIALLGQELWVKKAYKLFTGPEYGGRQWQYPFFKNTERESFDQIVLRSNHTEGPYGSRLHTVTRDQLGRELFWAMGQTSPAGDFYQLFVNGRYRGLYSAQERPSEKFFQFYEGEGAYEIIKSSAVRGERRYEVMAASALEKARNRLDSIDEILGFLGTELIDLNNPDNYAWIDARVDIANLIDYHLLNSFSHNGDWGGGNWNFYAYRKRASDGKWRFLPWDIEVTWHPIISPLNVFRSSIRINRNSYFIQRLISHLWTTHRYQRAFVARARQLMEGENAALSREYMLSLHDELWGQVAPDIDAQNPFYDLFADVDWEGGFAGTQEGIVAQSELFLPELLERGGLSIIDILHVAPTDLDLKSDTSANRLVIDGRGFAGDIQVELDGHTISHNEVPLTGVNFQRLEIYVPLRQYSQTSELIVRRRDNGDEVSGHFVNLSHPGASFVRGDANGDGRSTIVDVITSLRHLYRGVPIPCKKALDANADNNHDLSDVIYMANFNFRRGPAPQAPFPHCGVDDERHSDLLDCSSPFVCQ